jgi:hypothetical protein
LMQTSMHLLASFMLLYRKSSSSCIGEA